MNIRSNFINLITSPYADNHWPESEWSRIESAYSSKERHYHTLVHLKGLYAVLEQHSSKLQDWEIVQFAIFYHDIVYDVKKQDNEEQSARDAERTLEYLKCNRATIDRCIAHILATKGHSVSHDPDTNLFTDADLSILGSVPEKYQEYSKQIRMEYAIYPDDVYRAGRAKVLESFLQKPSIYKTKEFSVYEGQARRNLKNERESLK